MGRIIDMCIHQEVCTYVQQGPEGVCGLRKICKHYPEDDEDIAPPKKKGRPKKERLDEEKVEDESGPKISEKVFKAAKARLEYLRDAGKLDENQVKALDSVKGKHFKTLSEPQKAQIIQMSEGISDEV